MKFAIKILGRTVALCTHSRKADIFTNRHYHWSGRIQNWLWHRGISVHNFIIGECTQDFSCCTWRNPEWSGFFEQLVAVADAAERGEHSGIMHVTRPPKESCGRQATDK